MRNIVLPLLLAMGAISNAHGQCTTPSGITTSYASNVTSFNWDTVSGATGYAFELKQAWDSWASVEWADTVTTNSYTLTGIMQSISLDWRLKTLCPGGESAYGYASTFTLPCPVPGSLNTTSIGMTGATINWTAAPGYNTTVSDFVASYRKSGTTTWVNLGHTFGTSKTITGLLPNTLYEWRVYQTCAYFNSTVVSSSFTTLACNSAGSNSSEWISRFKLGAIDRTSTAESGGYVNTSATCSLVVGSTSNHAQIRVGQSGGFTNKVFKVYIDYNNNSIYEETEVAYGPSTLTSTGLHSFDIAIPTTAPNGLHGMRVIMARTGTTITGCMTGFNGETEDYKVSLSGGTHKASPSVSEEPAESEKITIFPNPATSNLTIQLPEAVTLINVYDMMGKRMHQQQAANGTMEINVAQWPATQYIVEAIYADGHREMSRFVKQ